MPNLVDKIQAAGGKQFRKLMDLIRAWSTVLIAVAAIVLIGLLIFAVYRTFNTQLATLWKDADQQFRIRHLEEARNAYESVQTFLSEKDRGESEEFVLANDMQDLSEACEQVLNAVESEAPQDAVDPLVAEVTSLDDVLSRFDDSKANSPVEDVDREDDDLPFGLNFDRTTRRKNALKLIDDESNSVGATVRRQITATDFPQQWALDRLSKLIDLLENHQRSTDDLREFLQHQTNRLTLGRNLESFEVLSTQAVKSLSDADIQATRDKWKDIEALFPIDRFPTLWTPYLDEDQKPKPWAAYVAQLREKALQAVNASLSAESLALPGVLDDSTPPVLPWKNYGALVNGPVGPQAESADDEEFVFARADDRCWVLNARNGGLRAVWQVGYDVPASPLSWTHKGRRLVAVLWNDDGKDCVTIMTSALKTLWTWKLPRHSPLAGAPKFINGHLILALTTGEIWKVEPDSGRALQKIQLPGRLASSILPREDERGGLVLAENLTVYVMSFSEAIRLVDVVYSDPSPNTVSTEAVWIPPYALIFENDILLQCRMTVLKQEPEGFHRVQQILLSGHIRQTPAVNGTRFLTMSDTGENSIFGLRINDPQPVFEISRSRPSKAIPERSFSIGHAAVPFIASTGHRLTSYKVDMLGTNNVPLSTVWTQMLDKEDAMPIQQLQPTSTGVVAVVRRPNHKSIRVTTVDDETGDVIWFRDIGCPATDWSLRPAVAARPRSVFIRSTSGDMFQLNSSNGAFTCQRAGHLDANSTLEFLPTKFAASWVSAAGPDLEVVSLNGSPDLRVPVVASAASPVAVRHVRTVVSASDNVQFSGDVAAFVDTERRIQIVPLSRDRATFTSGELGDVPFSGWHRPLWINDQELLVSHPDGHLVRCVIEADQGVFLVRYESRRRFLEALTTAPMPVGDHIFISNADRTSAFLDSRSLTTVTRFASGKISTSAVVFGQEIYAGTESGHLIRIDPQNAVTPNAASPVTKVSLSEDTVRPLEWITLSDDQTGLVCAADDGELFVLKQGGKKVAGFSASAPLSLPPLLFGETVLIATTEGSVEQFTVPAAKHISEVSE